MRFAFGLVLGLAMVWAGPSFAVSAKTNAAMALYGLAADGLKVTPTQKDLCPRENYCEGMIGTIQFQAFGAMIDLTPSSDGDQKVYMSACAAILFGLSTVSPEKAAAYVARAFDAAPDMASGARYDVGKVTMTVKPDGSRLACHFVRP